MPVADRILFALDDTQLATVPGPSIPAGYGNYCSVTYPGGAWAFEDLTSGDSCADIEKQFGSAGTIQRAGYWSTTNFNNAMVRCDGGVRYYYLGSTDSALAAAFKAVKDAHLKNCVFTVAPVALPLFGWPYDPTKPVSGLGVFTYDHYLQKWNPTEFGKPADPWQTANCPNPGQDWCYACAFDRTGIETGRCESCQATFAPPPASVVQNGNWQCQQHTTSNGNEPAYDWTLPAGTKLMAVANGIVRGSQCRIVNSKGAADCQEELFIESQIGSGPYAEHFVAVYHHMDPNGHGYWDGHAWHAIPPIGVQVKAGDTIGIVGNSGTNGGAIHLDFQVVRLTNLTGARSYVFAPVNGGYGFNGWQGIIDPFGWAGAKGVDPGAVKFIGYTDLGNTPANITDLGAYSINLWGAKVWPPTNGSMVK